MKHIENFKVDIQKNELAVQASRKYLNENMHKTRPFTDSQIKFLRELADTKWEKMLKRVENMQDEVFSEIMEQEMALAGLDSEILEEHIPSTIKLKQQKSLLGRLNTFKSNILAKKERGLVPKYEASENSLIDECSGDDSAHQKEGENEGSNLKKQTTSGSKGSPPQVPKIIRVSKVESENVVENIKKRRTANFRQRLATRMDSARSR